MDLHVSGKLVTPAKAFFAAGMGTRVRLFPSVSSDVASLSEQAVRTCGTTETDIFRRISC
jgi:hypothetical protein